MQESGVFTDNSTNLIPYEYYLTKTETLIVLEFINVK